MANRFWTWVQSVDFLAQSAHCGWAGFIVLGFGLWLPWWQAVSLLVVYTLLKEFFVDYYWFGEGHGYPDVLDATFYGVGGVLAVGLLLLKLYL